MVEQMNINRFSFKFQYDNTLSIETLKELEKDIKFKFQYDNTLSNEKMVLKILMALFKFQYDNTLSIFIS